MSIHNSAGSSSRPRARSTRTRASFRLPSVNWVPARLHAATALVSPASIAFLRMSLARAGSSGTRQNTRLFRGTYSDDRGALASISSNSAAASADSPRSSSQEDLTLELGDWQSESVGGALIW